MSSSNEPVKLASRKKYRDRAPVKQQPYSSRTGHSGPQNPNAPKAPPVGFRYKRKGQR